MALIPPDMKRSVRDAAAFAIGALIGAIVTTIYALWYFAGGK